MAKNLIGNISGPSAYDIAVAEGFVGTEAAWLASLVGDVTPAAVAAKGAAERAAADAVSAKQDAEQALGVIDEKVAAVPTPAELSATFATGGEMRSKVKADGTDQSETLLAEIAALSNAGGGTLLLPKGTIRVDSQIAIPFTLDGTGAPQQPSLVFKGVGAWSSGRGSGFAHAPIGGTILDLRYNGTAAKILTRGFGRLEATGITFTDNGLSSLPFIKSTNTAIHIHGNAFIGNPAKKHIQCDQDAIVLGGNNVPVGGDFDTTDNGPFQGYGAIIEGNWFNRIRRIVFGQVYSNGSIVRDNTVWQFCGSNLADGACIEFNPGPGNMSVFGNVITGNLLEVGGYPYGIALDFAQQNTLGANNFYDQSAITLAYIRMKSGNAKYNILNLGYGYIGANWPGGVHVSEQTVGTNVITDSFTNGNSQQLSRVNFLNGLRTSAAFSTGAGTPEIVVGSGTLAAGIYTGAGAPAFVAPTGSVYLRTSGDYGLTLYVKEANDTTAVGWVPYGPSAVASYAARASNYIAAAGDRYITLNGGASSTLTLPTGASAGAGKVYTVKNINAVASTVQVASAGTIDGALTASLAQWQAQTFVSDGANWLTV